MKTLSNQEAWFKTANQNAGRKNEGKFQGSFLIKKFIATLQLQLKIFEWRKYSLKSFKLKHSNTDTRNTNPDTLTQYISDDFLSFLNLVFKFWNFNLEIRRDSMNH